MQPSSRHLLFRLLAFIIVLVLVACSAGEQGVPSLSGTDLKVPTGTKPSMDAPAESGNNQETDVKTESTPERDTGAGTTEDIHCTETDPHPIGQGIAESYDVTYEEVMVWFCSGYTFDDILIALETSEATGVKAVDLLAMSEGMGWEEVWVEVGFTPK